MTAYTEFNDMDNFTELGNKELYRKLLSSDYEKRPYQREDLGEGMSLVHELRDSYWKPRYLMDNETGMAYEFMDGRNTLVTFTIMPSMERPLFLLQYVSELPAIAPSPVCLPSCIKTITISAILIIINTIVKIVFNTATC